MIHQSNERRSIQKINQQFREYRVTVLLGQQGMKFAQQSGTFGDVLSFNGVLFKQQVGFKDIDLLMGDVTAQLPDKGRF